MLGWVGGEVLMAAGAQRDTVFLVVPSREISTTPEMAVLKAPAFLWVCPKTPLARPLITVSNEEAAPFVRCRNLDFPHG